MEEVKLTLTACLAAVKENFMQEIGEAKNLASAYEIIEKTLKYVIDLCCDEGTEERRIADSIAGPALIGAGFVKSPRHPQKESGPPKVRKGIKAKFIARRIFLIILGVLLIRATIIFALSPYGGVSKNVSPMYYIFFILGALCLFLAGNLNLADSTPVGEKDLPIVMDPLRSYANLVEIAIVIDEELERYEEKDSYKQRERKESI